MKVQKPKFIFIMFQTLCFECLKLLKFTSLGLKVSNDVAAVTLVNLMQASKPHEHSKPSEGDKISNIEIPTINRKPEENIPGYMPLQEVKNNINTYFL